MVKLKAKVFEHMEINENAYYTWKKLC